MHTWIVADWHLRHKNILKYDDRPFSTIEEHDKTIIERTNEKVKEDDRLIYVGDMVFGEKKFEAVIDFRKKINCKNIWYVRGNHDGESFYGADGKLIRKGWSYEQKDYAIEQLRLFKCIEDVLYVKWTIPHLFTSHYAHRTWPGQGKGTIHIYAHSHHNLPDDPHSFSMDVGCNGNNYYPYSMVDIRAWMNLKTPKPMDHHNAKNSW